jgi:hypothetical protein
MNYYESVVIDYLRADRALFVNTECCVQINESDNPDNSGPHWYCDAVICDLKSKAVFLGEISYSSNLGGWTKEKGGLISRLRDWNRNWPGVLFALSRDCGISPEWPVRPWLFVPEKLVPKLLVYLQRIGTEHPLSFCPRITPLEMVQPWRYRSWNRKGEDQKSSQIPVEMQI